MTVAVNGRSRVEEGGGGEEGRADRDIWNVCLAYDPRV